MEVCLQKLKCFPRTDIPSYMRYELIKYECFIRERETIIIIDENKTQ